MIKIDNQIRFLGFILVLFLITFQSSFAADAGTNYNEAKEYVEDVRTITPNLPTVNNQKWVVGSLLSRLFDTNGQIWNLFIKALWTRTDTAVLRWSGWDTGQFVQWSIFDSWSNVSIWGTPLSNRKLSVYWDINFTWNLYRDWNLVNFAGKFIDGTNTNNAVYTGWNVGIGKQPTQALDVNGTVLATNFSWNGASITNINASNISSWTINTARLPSDVVKTTWNQTIAWVKTFSSWIAGNGSAITNINGDNIQNGTIDSSEIEDNTITENDISDSFVARDSSLLDGIDSTSFARKDMTNTFLEALTISNANYNAHLNLVRSGETWNITPSIDGSLNFLHPTW